MVISTNKVNFKNHFKNPVEIKAILRCRFWEFDLIHSLIRLWLALLDKPFSRYTSQIYCLRKAVNCYISWPLVNIAKPTNGKGP